MHFSDELAFSCNCMKFLSFHGVTADNMEYHAVHIANAEVKKIVETHAWSSNYHWNSTLLIVNNAYKTEAYGQVIFNEYIFGIYRFNCFTITYIFKVSFS